MAPELNPLLLPGTTSPGYRELLDELYRVRARGVVFGLTSVREALARLGHPERDLGLVVHIGGTNGKGSTATFVASILRASGVRTGLFTSPHIATFTERFRIDGQPVSQAALVDAFRTIQSHDMPPLTFFEQCTLLALTLFARARVQATVLEVGLGGRLDATNAVDAQIACVTGVSYDHQDMLGDTLEQIACEKAGIFKPGQHAVIGRAGEPHAVAWLASHARAAGTHALSVVRQEVPASWPLGLPGAFQRDNAACALAIIDAYEAVSKTTCPSSARREGLATAQLAGRLQTVATAPRIVVDGAHNAHAARMLAQAARAWQAPRILVLGISQGKAAHAMVEALSAIADEVVATQARTSRAMPASKLQDVIRAVSQRPVAVYPRVSDALAYARERAGTAGTVLVTGSLYVVGEARSAVLGDALDPVDTSDPVSKDRPRSEHM